jgi:hypothetical protein
METKRVVIGDLAGQAPRIDGCRIPDPSVRVVEIFRAKARKTPDGCGIATARGHMCDEVWKDPRQARARGPLPRPIHAGIFSAVGTHVQLAPNIKRSARRVNVDHLLACSDTWRGYA